MVRFLTTLAAEVGPTQAQIGPQRSHKMVAADCVTFQGVSGASSLDQECFVKFGDLCSFMDF